MIEDHFFLKNNVVDIDAAVVGVSKTRWVNISEQEANLSQAQEMMSRHRFDVLPIVANDGSIKEYFHTKTWNDYSSIEQKKIDYNDVISFRTPLRSLIRDFAKEKRLFYFLANEERIVGLVSVANLNCRQVRTFIFSLISELEVRLSQFISSVMSETEILSSGIGENSKKRYNSDKEEGLDPELMEYLYLSDLINIIGKRNLFNVLDYPSKTKLQDSLGRINCLRNQAAHPTRSLITNADSIGKLWDKIEIIERCLFRLRQVKRK